MRNLLIHVAVILVTVGISGTRQAGTSGMHNGPPDLGTMQPLPLLTAHSLARPLLPGKLLRYVTTAAASLAAIPPTAILQASPVRIATQTVLP